MGISQEEEEEEETLKACLQGYQRRLGASIALPIFNCVASKLEVLTWINQMQNYVRGTDLTAACREPD
jgi:hypothetical protein